RAAPCASAAVRLLVNKTSVLIAPTRQLTCAPSGPHPPWEIATRIKTPMSPPKSIVSPARNTHIPSLPISKLVGTSCGAWAIPISTAEFAIRFRSTLRGAGLRRCCLRSPILFHPGHAILIWPAYDRRYGVEVLMRWRRVRGPFKRGGMPRIRRSLRAAEHAQEEVQQEWYLPGDYDQQADGCNYVQRLERFVVGVNGRQIDSPLAAADADQEERNEYRVEADPCENEVDLAQSFIHHSAEHLREPIVDPAKARDDGRRHERVVEMGDYKIGVVQVDV